MEATASEWANLVVRWAHVFAGILWIGSTWYFTWLDRTLHASGGGGVLMVHSGGFYKVDKLAETRADPSKIHWFRYEALVTWLTGLVLLAIVYWPSADMMSETLGHGAAIGLGIGLLAVGWVVYDLLWSTPIPQLAGAAVSWLLLVAIAFGLTRAFNGRAAFIHLGAMMGTIMVLNVWVRILPAQRKLVAALAEGRPGDPRLAAQAKMRSMHNTFIILPVLMTMISNHFPTATYGAQAPWAVFGVLVLAGWGGAKLVRELR